MSRTDNTRPWWVQAEDLSESGFICHCCTKDQRRDPMNRRRNHKRPVSVKLLDPAGDELWVRRRRNTTWVKFLAQYPGYTLVTSTYHSPVQLECDYWPDGLAQAKQHDRQRPSCRRLPRNGGGSNYLGGRAKAERQQRRRKIRSRERQALWWALYGLDHEFDLLPIREDARTLNYDVSD